MLISELITFCFVFLFAVVFSIIICLIAAFRINAVYQSHLDNCIYDIGGFTPVYSISFYAVVCMGFLSFISSLVSTTICHEVMENSSFQSSRISSEESSTGISLLSRLPWGKSRKSNKPKTKGSSRTTKQVSSFIRLLFKEIFDYTSSKLYFIYI